MNLTENKEGKYLYKYVPFNQYSLQLLINKEFWLGSPDLLNDPFEGDFIIGNYQEYFNQECINILLDWIVNCKHSEIVFDLSYFGIMKDVNVFLNALYAYLNYNYISNNFGTTSFSMNCDSLLMWSHYADSHKGFVIVFDRNAIDSSITDEMTSIKDVDYDGLPKVKLVIDNNKISITEDEFLLVKKLPIWEKEKEVRIITKR